MNKHINKNKANRVQPAQFVKPVERPDGMPPEVATEMLLKAPLTNRLRKTLNAARAAYCASTLKPIEKALKLEARFKQSTWAQLAKWKRRAASRRQEAQDSYQTISRRMVKMSTDVNNPEHQARAVLAKVQLQRLEKLVEQIDIFSDVVSEEMARRRGFVLNLSEVAPSLAKKLEKSLCPSGQ